MNIKNPSRSQGANQKYHAHYNINPKLQNKTAEDIAHLVDAKSVGKDRFMGRCPAHEDKSPSLAIAQAPERVLLYCHAGCAYESILSALGLESKQLNYQSNSSIPRSLKVEGTLLPLRQFRETLDTQLRVCLIANQKRLRYEPLTSEEKSEEKLAIQRVVKAWEVLA